MILPLNENPTPYFRWGRRSAPVGPLGADLRVAPCYVRHRVLSVSARSRRVSISLFLFPVCLSTMLSTPFEMCVLLASPRHAAILAHIYIYISVHV